MQCECGGALLDGKSSHSVSRDNFSIIIDNIPAYKCTRCDRILFDEEVVEKIQKLVNKVERDVNEVISGKPSANLYDY
jgi:YgiT-type zinc finger domain-containing protein